MTSHDQPLFDLLQRLGVFDEQEASKICVRFNETSGERDLIRFLLDGQYINLGHLGRVAAMERSAGGDLSAEERRVLGMLRTAMVQHFEQLDRASVLNTDHGDGR